jgi:DNA-binding MarR family transcriptional regulator
MMGYANSPRQQDRDVKRPKKPYVLEEQAGFILRQATQRHVTIFSQTMPAELTPPQFSAICVLHQKGTCSQNQLGRFITTDAATIKGVVDRLTKRGLVQTAADPDDGRMLLVSLTPAGQELAVTCIEAATEITALTLAPLTAPERKEFLRLLKKLR